MQIIDQGYKILSLSDHALRDIELAGRTAYQSEDHIEEDSDKRFVKMINSKSHGAVIEFADLTVQFTTDRGVSHELVRHRMASFCQESTRYCNYSKDKFGNSIQFIRPSWVSPKDLGLLPTDGAWLKSKALSRRESTQKRMRSMLTVFRNLFGKKKVEEKPTPTEEIIQQAIENWYLSCYESEQSYFGLLTAGWTPQQARTVLNNSLKTTITVKANFREWQHIFRLRGIEKAAHPQMRDLILPLYFEMREKYPEVFDLGDPE